MAKRPKRRHVAIQALRQDLADRIAGTGKAIARPVGAFASLDERQTYYNWLVVLQEQENRSLEAWKLQLGIVFDQIPFGSRLKERLDRIEIPEAERLGAVTAAPDNTAHMDLHSEDDEPNPVPAPLPIVKLGEEDAAGTNPAPGNDVHFEGGEPNPVPAPQPIKISGMAATPPAPGNKVRADAPRLGGGKPSPQEALHDLVKTALEAVERSPIASLGETIEAHR